MLKKYNAGRGYLQLENRKQDSGEIDCAEFVELCKRVVGFRSSK
jgi:hypothetical protein